jgi:CRP-like cAMP-binding protein/phosphoribosyl 1,2-cyclic phosphodiesterase
VIQSPANKPIPSESPVVRLSRGGVYIATPHGPVQVGAPPETIKDSMGLGVPLPEVFVVPPDLFDRRRGLTLAEIEFPAYYNFFVLKRRARLIVETNDTANRLRTVFRESLFGSRVQAKDDEFAEAYPRELRPDFERETDHFRRAPDGTRQDVDDLVEFCVMGDARRVDLPTGVSVARTDDGMYVISADGREIARVPALVEVPDRTPASVPSSPVPFEPPSFGVTVLGASHGFDPNGKTTGFLLWIGHRGILIDPPVDTTQRLREQGVMPKLIDGVILTHCHADHDSGVLAKLLEEGRVRLYTTPTILNSFLRKYSALSGIPQDVLRRTFSFFPVTIGSPTAINGAELFFFYTLHSVPTIGFEAFYGGKSLAFSSDTLYDPDEIRKVCERGVITPERRDALLDFPWHHTVVLHEAGVPPLHTPVRALAALPAEVKQRLYLVHIAKKDVPAASGLRGADVGLDKTLVIDVHDPVHAQAMDILNVFCSVDFFRDLPLSRARELLMVARRRRVAAGERIIEKGTPGNEFFVISSGSVSVERNGQRIKTYHSGDFFGETALVLNQARTADVVARTDVDMMTLDRHGFLYLLRGTDIARRLVRLARAREERSWELLETNSALRQLSGAQKTQLQSYLDLVTLRAGDELWREGDKINAAYLIDQGEVELLGDESEHTAHGGAPKPFGPGALLADIDGLRDGRQHDTTARVLADVRAFQIDAADFAKFLGDNPGVLLFLMGTHFAE